MKISKKGDFENPKVLNQSPVSSIFSIVRFSGCAKNVPSGDLLYTYEKIGGILLKINVSNDLTANIFESGPMPTP